MVVQIFTLCDGAYNYNGKLTIVGTIDNIKVPKVPTVAAVGFALKISFSQQERGEKTIAIRFKGPNGQLIMPEINTNSGPGQKGADEKIVIAGNVNGLSIQEYGDHVVELSVNGESTNLPFKVVK